VARKPLKHEMVDIAVRLHIALRRESVWADMIILFGSQAKGNARKHSDIDIAVVSRNFGKDKLVEGAMLDRVAVKIDTRIEALPFSLKEYKDPRNISPILHEIKKHGICIV
jgi:predicted nucleotidyltransferase